jgi:hypothetical protein
LATSLLDNFDNPVLEHMEKHEEIIRRTDEYLLKDEEDRRRDRLEEGTTQIGTAQDTNDESDHEEEESLENEQKSDTEQPRSKPVSVVCRSAGRDESPGLLAPHGRETAEC